MPLHVDFGNGHDDDEPVQLTAPRQASVLAAKHCVVDGAYDGTHAPLVQLYDGAQVDGDGQTLQRPDVPQAAVVSPATQVPLEQQPLLHGWVPLHAVVHWCVVPSQAWPPGQSLGSLQPHAPLARQALPLALPAQLLQIEPTAPHALVVMPGWQVPAVGAEQQPDWHAVAVEQELTQRWPAVSHDEAPPAQSVMAAHPHWPPPVMPTHLWPF